MLKRNLGKGKGEVNEKVKQKKKIIRIRKREEFLNVRKGEKRRGKLFMMEVRERKEEEQKEEKKGDKKRVGLKVKKKKGNEVIRNRIRRRMKEEISCKEGSEMENQKDYVIVEREKEIKEKFQKMKEEI